MNSEIQQMLTAAQHAVAGACGVTRMVQSRLSEVKEITKDDRSPVTVADFAAQAIIAHSLQTSFGRDSLRIVGEESAGVLRGDDQQHVKQAVVDAVRCLWADAGDDAVLDAIDACNHDASADSYWTLDPVDGTKGFLRGGQYAVSLSWIDKGEVVIGVMGCPNLSADFEREFHNPDPHGMIFYATKGGGTWCIPSDDVDKQPIVVKVDSDSDSDNNGLMRVCESVEAAHSKHDTTAKIADLLGGVGTPARLDSQCKYAVVARGQADAYLRMPTKPGYVEKIWDHAAGVLVATEAGVVVSDVEGKPLDFSHGAKLENNRGVVCASSRFHSKIISVISEHNLASPLT